MTTLRFLLRVVLVLALVLNGAGVRAMVAATPAKAVAAHACHDMVATAADAESQDALASENSGAPIPGHCCDSGRCDCACTHVPALAQVALTIPRMAAPAAPVRVGLAAPAVDIRISPFRPPIV